MDFFILDLENSCLTQNTLIFLLGSLKLSATYHVFLSVWSLLRCHRDDLLVIMLPNYGILLGWKKYIIAHFCHFLMWFKYDILCLWSICSVLRMAKMTICMWNVVSNPQRIMQLPSGFGAFIDFQILFWFCSLEMYCFGSLSCSHQLFTHNMNNYPFLLQMKQSLPPLTLCLCYNIAHLSWVKETHSSGNASDSKLPRCLWEPF